ncbi:gamma-glutamyl-gamma-aminobutyrate hydrolase family protein [Fructobacillus sp. M1-13]|uniref:Gamma-glutamyl-gamma-aminobutyrate hydrolase family protein n=1 Tax=Fructobacillus papyriferae TaxID=2713171 RepID=A0ABS5QPF7_9LACO|nr:gamma-glutamyl-gamma-aminobutyrate hydrolase family protein [Fructobacillus papyriferae]MBS9335048.1 gamma-glutamyl-gamma-aminobutyrate hydrolase family protein [Fructobacillus papyriferae]MCD2159466.1 gamma-glutamyl-gamma-aminobutyrate hydrolase family protein [Fructobacillus papyriferae]
MKIAITADVNLQDTPIINMQYASYVPKPIVDIVMEQGHLPVVFPIAKKELAAEFVSMVDAVIIPGGPDVSPFVYEEEPHQMIGTTYPERDIFELAIIKEAVKAGKPVFGICRGAQIINAYYGGTMYQDLTSQYQQDHLMQHSQAARGFIPVHHVNVEKDSFLGQVFGDKAFVNSRHHQAIHQVGDGLEVTACSADGIVEGIEHQVDPVLAVQWHPENLWLDMPEEKALFTHFFDYVKEQQHGK